MTKAELLIRSILGPRRGSIRPLVLAVEHATDLLFNQQIDWEDLNVTKDLYPHVARQLKINPAAACRGIERLSNHCWNALDSQQVLQYIGKPLRDISAPSDMICYLTYYLRYDKPYYQVLQEELEQTFSSI